MTTPQTEHRPLAERMRPKTLDEYIGQRHILGESKQLRAAIEQDRLHSMLFWGPPGTGKTTLARLIAQYSGAEFITMSAVLSGVKDIREAVKQAGQLAQRQEAGAMAHAKGAFSRRAWRDGRGANRRFRPRRGEHSELRCQAYRRRA